VREYTRLEFHQILPNVVSVVVALLALYGTFQVVQTNERSAVIANRAYVSVEMVSPRRYEIRRPDGSVEDVGYGGDIVLANRGKTPASGIVASYYITTDKDQGENFGGREWFVRTLGDYPAVAFLPPDSSAREIGRRSLSPTARYYYFEALVVYDSLAVTEGTYWAHVKRFFGLAVTEDAYWTHVKRVFLLEGGSLLPIRSDGDWDRNGKPVPRLSTKDEVRAVFADLERNRTPKR
jgi:hypothetical protein